MEEVFNLTYSMNITYSDINLMSPSERRYLCERLYKQLKDEAQEMKKARMK